MTKKYEINTEAFTNLIFSVVKYCVVCLISLVIFLGYNLYRNLIDPTPFQAWTFVGIIIICVAFLLQVIFMWKFYNFFWIPILIVVVAALGNLPVLFKISLIVFIIVFLYELLKIFGLEIKGKIKSMKLYWRGKKLK